MIRELGLTFSFNLPARYEEALRFRSRPDQASAGAWDDAQLRELARQWAEIVLHVEGVRTGLSWASVDEYGAWAGIREPEMNTYRVRITNLGRNLSAGGLSFLHPREALYRRLPNLLLCGTETPGWQEQSGQFLSVWRRFN
jgi:hypothetical protein